MTVMSKNGRLRAAFIMTMLLAGIFAVNSRNVASSTSVSPNPAVNQPTSGSQGWVKQGMVIRGTDGQSWGYYICEPDVMYENGVFKMWYRGSTASQTNPQIGFANSTDGIHWVRYGPPIIHGNLTGYLAGPCVLHNDSNYIMYVINTTIRNTLSLLTSADGLNWVPVASDILELPYWASGFGHFYVWRENSEWYMLYEAGVGTMPLWKIGLANSTDGINWVQYEANPILENNNYLGGAGGPFVVHIGNMYGVWYHGGGLPTDIYYTNSTTLRTKLSQGSLVIARSLQNEVLPAYYSPYYGGQDVSQITDPHLLEVNGQTWMYYTATPDHATSDINLAISNLTLTEMLGQNTTSPSPTPTPPVTGQPTPPPPQLPVPTLAVNCTSYSTESNWKVDIDGYLALNGTGLPGTSILIAYSVNGGYSWQDLTMVDSGPDGRFSAEWLPSATGNYLIRATYTGNSTVSAVSTVVNLAVTPFNSQGTKGIFSVASNSTISDLVFNSTGKILTFTVAGPTGTTGYADVSIAKTLITGPTDVNAYVDGSKVDYTISSGAEYWLLHITYRHSTHQIMLNLARQGTQPQTLQTTLVVAGVTVAIVIVILILIIRRKHK
jgi:hypothetical protein